MVAIAKPDYTYVWASGGNKATPPSIKIQTGWIAEPPPYQYENWSQNRQDQAIAHIFQRGIAQWDSLTNYEANICYVTGSDGLVYKSVAASGPSSIAQDPVTDATDTYWTIAFASPGSFLTPAAGDARYTQRANNLSDLSNVVTARTNLSVYSKAESEALLPRGYFYGFQMSNSGSSPNTTVTVGAGQCKTSDNLYSLSLNTAISGILQVSGNWTAGDNQNKLDTGAKAINSWYHVFAIRKTSDGSGDIIFSLNETTPTMPSGYSGFRRIGSIRTDASGNILGFLNYGNVFILKNQLRDVDTTSLSNVQTNYTITTPLGVRTTANVLIGHQGNERFVNFGNPDLTLVAPTSAVSAGVMGIGIATGDATDSWSMNVKVVTNTSSQISAIANTTSTSFYVVTNGWEETFR